MKIKSIFGIENSIAKALGFAEKSLETLSVKFGNKMDKWLGNTPKSKYQKRTQRREKEHKNYLDMIAEQHQYQGLEMRNEKSKPNVKKINERFMDLEKQSQEMAHEKETSLDTDIER